MQPRLEPAQVWALGNMRLSPNLAWLALFSWLGAGFLVAVSVPPGSHGRWVGNLKGPQPGYLLGRVLAPEAGNPAEILEGDGASLVRWRQAPSTCRTVPCHPVLMWLLATGAKPWWGDVCADTAVVSWWNPWTCLMLSWEAMMCVICSLYLRYGADPWDHLRAVLTHTSHRGSLWGQRQSW